MRLLFHTFVCTNIKNTHTHTKLLYMSLNCHIFFFHVFWFISLNFMILFQIKKKMHALLLCMCMQQPSNFKKKTCIHSPQFSKVKFTQNRNNFSAMGTFHKQANTQIHSKHSKTNKKTKYIFYKFF